MVQILLLYLLFWVHSVLRHPGEDNRAEISCFVLIHINYEF